MIPNDSKATEPDFTTLGLSEASLQVVRELGYTHLTPIQARALPPLLLGQDLIGQSATGSGKTVAFALPMLEKLDVASRALQGLVLCPTRELANQVASTVRTLGRHRPGLRVLVLAGGLPSGPQRKALTEGVHIVVGTPGRVQHHLDRGLLVDSVRTVVLDEADRMLDMGFQEAVETILRALPVTRQTAFFSATFPPSIAFMSRTWQKKPAKVMIATDARDLPAIRQVAHLVDKDERIEALGLVLRSHVLASVLVFCNYKASVRTVAEELRRDGLEAAALHGDLDQQQRDREMAKFRNGTTKILVATDVAARGLDIAGLDAVINYEFPIAADTYVHRIGRTGRAGAPGLAISLVTHGDTQRLAQAEEAVGGTIARLPVPNRQKTPLQPDVPVVAMATLFISGGRSDKLRTTDILGALTGEAGVKAADIGRIEIHDRFTYVALAHQVAVGLLKKSGGLRIKGRTFRIELAE
jgi:ATP-independent RNA helicase DbpA